MLSFQTHEFIHLQILSNDKSVEDGWNKESFPVGYLDNEMKWKRIGIEQTKGLCHFPCLLDNGIKPSKESIPIILRYQGRSR